MHNVTLTKNRHVIVEVRRGGFGVNCLAQGVLKATTNPKTATPRQPAIILSTKKHFIKSFHFPSILLLHSSISIPSGKLHLIPSIITSSHLCLSSPICQFPYPSGADWIICNQSNSYPSTYASSLINPSHLIVFPVFSPLLLSSSLHASLLVFYPYDTFIFPPLFPPITIEFLDSIGVLF